MSDSIEFVIDKYKEDIVVKFLPRIERLFSVRVTFTNGDSTDQMLWVVVKGHEDKRAKAKDYIKALTSPEHTIVVTIPASLVSRLGADTHEHLQLETEYGVVIRYQTKTQAIILGNTVAVTLASSKLEDLKNNFEKITDKIAKDNKALEDFALKLGYEQAEVTAVFEKLGPKLDKNTFLNELITFSKQRSSRASEERKSPIPMPNGGSARTNGYPRDMYSRHPNDMVVSKGISSGGMNHFSGVNYLRPESSGVVSRGCIRTTAQTSQSNLPSATYTMARDYGHPSGGLYNTVTNDFNQFVPDQRQVEQMFQDLLTNSCHYQQFPTSDLRHVVIDGSNVAMSHGNNKVFSCKGIALCIDWFIKRGHTQITVFVPQWRKESAKPESPITDQHLLNKLEEQGYLTFTPSRRINGRRIVCYDDRFVIRLADKTDGVIVSNDNFKDLAQENSKWKEVIEKRLLMYSFVNDMFMPPDDPLGRHGPTLDEFLHKGTPTHRRLCPYGRRCTYGNRCKFHHPEREDKQRLQVYTTLKDMFPSQDALVRNVMKQYPQENDAQKLALLILDMN